MEMNKELLKKAKTAKSVDELITLAKENGGELTREEAKTYFDCLNARTGELVDDELDSVSGGGKCGTIYKDNWPVIVAGLNSCEHYEYDKTKAKTTDCTSCIHRDSSGFVELCKCPKRYDN